MDELIKQIINIESKAQEVMSSARTAEKELEQRVTLGSIKLENDINTQERDKNTSIRQMENDEAEKRLEEIDSETEKKLSELERTYEINRDKWVRSIVEGVIGGNNE